MLQVETKNKRARTIPLVEPMLALLQEQSEAQAEERLSAGSTWVDSGLIFANDFGGPTDPRNLLRVVKAAAEKTGLTSGLHTLRHSAAVAMLESGAHIKAVSDLLGHSSISITGDTYGHTSQEAARHAMDSAAAILAR